MMFQAHPVQVEIVTLSHTTGLALGMHLAGLQWRVRAVMLAGPLSYYHEQQTMLTSAFAANYMSGLQCLPLKGVSVNANVDVFLLALSAYLMLRMVKGARR